MHVGYARVSTKDQTIDLQIDALTQAGCTKVYTEVISGAGAEWPVLDQLFETLRAGDVLVIWKLDRLGRSLTHLLEIVTDLMTRQVGLKSLNDPIDTTTPQGRLIFTLFASLAEFEREVIRERTQAGLSATPARGRTGGRPKGIPRKAEATAYAAETLYREGRLSAQGIADKLHISKTTLYAYLRARRADRDFPRPTRHAAHHTGLGDVGAHQTDLRRGPAGFAPASDDAVAAQP